MAEIAHSINLNLPEKLQDRDYRRAFFWAQASAEIAEGLVKLRKRRELNQKQVAEKIGTKQPAISRAEKADYQNWNLNTLRSIAEALDARIRVLIEPYEDVIAEYEIVPVAESDWDMKEIVDQGDWASTGLPYIAFALNKADERRQANTYSIVETMITPFEGLGHFNTTNFDLGGAGYGSIVPINTLLVPGPRKADEKDKIIAEKDREIADLKRQLLDKQSAIAFGRTQDQRASAHAASGRFWASPRGKGSPFGFDLDRNVAR